MGPRIETEEKIDEKANAVVRAHRRRRRRGGRPRRGCALAAGDGPLSAPLVLVEADGCLFCKRAREVLDALGVEARTVMADSAEATSLSLRGIPLAFLPVLTDGERLIAYGRFSQKHLRRELGL